METINNIAGAASKAIWGENNTASNETGGQEPLSGQQGKGTASEPYDQGNKENPTSTSTTSTTSTTNPTSTSTSDKPTTSTVSETPTASSKPPVNPSNAANAGPPRPEHETDKTGVTGNMSTDRAASDINPSNASDNPGAAPSSGAAPSHKQQGADKPKAAPSGEEADAVKSKKDEGEQALKKKDPNDHSGEPLKMHDGSEHKSESETKDGQEGGGEQDKESKGTGEQYVKTTGVHADGGDFDATKPGAGREADRLLEEKGVDRSAPNQPGSGAPAHDDSKGSKSSKDSKDSKDKPSVGQKIKDKLHIGSKDK